MKTFNMKKFYKYIRYTYNNKYSYVSMLCPAIHSLQDSEISYLWNEHWNEINTDNNVFITDYFGDSCSREEVSLLRLMVLIDFCNHYDIKIINDKGI